MLSGDFAHKVNCIEKLDVMCSLGLYINDLSMHDSSRDLVLAGTQQSAELRLALDQELIKSAKLEESMKELDIEKRRTDSLLYQMIPRTVADRLRQGEPALNTCEMFHGVSVLFSDVVGFTHICSLISPMEVVTMLNNMYTVFDQISEQHNVYKVETIGDAYMVVSGVPERSMYHAEHVADLALDMIAAMPTLSDPSKSSEHLKIRIGVHTGMVVAGVVGLKMPRYCLFGDTVNTASRMESTGLAMKIHISETTHSCLQAANYLMKQRGSIDIKGKGGMKTFWLVGKKEGAEAVQSYMSMVGGHTTAIGGHNLQGEMSDATMESHTLKPRVDSVPEEEEVIGTEDDVMIPQKDSPVAYYGHVPHTPHNSNNGVYFQWEKVNVKQDTLIEVDDPPVEEKRNKSDMKNGPNTQEEAKATNSTLTTMCSLF